MSTSSSETIFRFSDFTLDTAKGVLLESGNEIELRAQSIMVLQILLENHGRLVTKEELNDQVWGRKAVTEDSLTQCLVDIRKALHDADRQLVRTIPRRGFRFEGDVEVVSAEPDDLRSRYSKRQIVTAALLLGIAGWAVSVFLFTTEQRPSIAVLRFDDMSNEQDLRFIGEGLAEDILNSLAHHQGIDVIARTSSFAYSGESHDVVTIADALDVDYVLEGSVRDMNDGLFRVVAQLIETESSSHEWSETFDVGVIDLASVHQAISGEVWTRIAPSADAAEVHVAVPGFTADELMLLARHYETQLREFAEVDQDLLAKALRWYRNAAAANPGSAKIQAGLARVLLMSGDAQTASEAVDRAVQLNAGSSEVQDVLARFRWATGTEGAGEAWARAVELNPNNADAIGSYGYWTWAQGGMDDAEPLLRRALELDLNSLSRYADLGNFLGNEARVDEVRELTITIQLRFDSAESYRVIARLLELIGDTNEGIAWLARARSSDPANPIYSWALAELFIDIGDYDTAERLDPDLAPGLLLKMGRYPEFIDAAEDKLFDEPGNLVLRYLLAFAYNVEGRPELAIWQLERAGLMRFLFPEVRQMWDHEAFVTWADAMHTAGRGEETLDRIHYFQHEFPHTTSSNWWRPYVAACQHSVLDEDDLALNAIELVDDSPRLPFLYLFRDAHCLQKYRDEPRYLAVIEDIENRQRELRARLPATLEQFAVEVSELQPDE